MKPGESKHTREQRVALVADWLRYEAKGGRKTEWCRDHQVPMPTLCGWLRQFETEARAKVASGEGAAPSPAASSPDNPGLEMVEQAIADLPEVDPPDLKPEAAEAATEQEPGGSGLMAAVAILVLVLIGGVLLGRGDGR